MRTQFLWFYFGTFLLALTLGVLTGISASPVVAVMIPLVFSVLTAGGAIYVIRGGTVESSTNLTEQRVRAGFLGKQLTVFALGFIMGLWSGVAGKFHSQSIWFISTSDSPLYSVMKINDLLLLSAAIDLDDRMTQAGVAYAGRLELFKQVGKGIESRSRDGVLAAYDLEAAKAIVARKFDVANEHKTRIFSGFYPPVAEHRSLPQPPDALRKDRQDG